MTPVIQFSRKLKIESNNFMPISVWASKKNLTYGESPEVLRKE